MKNLYLDIDGVILTLGGKPAQHLSRFLIYILENYRVSWLTSRCSGDTKYTIKYLAQFLPEETMPLINMINPTKFALDKTEAIDFGREFFWLDDDLFDSEKKTLMNHNELNSWIEINLIKNPDQLLDLISSRLKNPVPLIIPRSKMPAALY